MIRTLISKWLVMLLFPGPSPLVPKECMPERVEGNKGPLVDRTDDCGTRRNSNEAAVTQLVETARPIRSERDRLAHFMLGPY